MLEGFFWGFGFSIALVSVLVFYAIFGHVAIENSYQRSMKQLQSETMQSFVDAMKLKLVDSKVVDQEILLTTKMLNLGLTPSSLGLSLRFSLYTKSGEFMGQCIDRIPSIDSKEETINILSECKSKLFSINEFHNATVAVVKR